MKTLFATFALLATVSLPVFAEELPPPGHGPHHMVACEAANRLNQRFFARGFSPRQAEEQALNECYRHTPVFQRSCHILGCREE